MAHRSDNSMEDVGRMKAKEEVDGGRLGREL